MSDLSKLGQMAEQIIEWWDVQEGRKPPLVDAAERQLARELAFLRRRLLEADRQVQELAANKPKEYKAGRKPAKWQALVDRHKELCATLGAMVVQAESDSETLPDGRVACDDELFESIKKLIQQYQ